MQSWALSPIESQSVSQAICVHIGFEKHLVSLGTWLVSNLLILSILFLCPEHLVTAVKFSLGRILIPASFSPGIPNAVSPLLSSSCTLPSKVMSSDLTVLTPQLSAVISWSLPLTTLAINFWGPLAAHDVLEFWEHECF